MGLSDKFGITFEEARNIFVSDMGEWRYCHKLVHDFGQSWISEFSFFYKVTFVGPLILCLKMPENMEKNKNLFCDAGAEKKVQYIL